MQSHAEHPVQGDGSVTSRLRASSASSITFDAGARHRRRDHHERTHLLVINNTPCDPVRVVGSRKGPSHGGGPFLFRGARPAQPGPCGCPSDPPRISPERIATERLRYVYVGGSESGAGSDLRSLYGWKPSKRSPRSSASFLAAASNGPR